ncbi:MAG: LysM peptidoglycan-binding domain-containing protein [Firmicutes bacterium]|nr:LysM peptidoglycan-binding domain-containing protein [Bacillota bacterium]
MRTFIYIAIFLSLLPGFFGLALAKPVESANTQKYYVSYTISKGDTLWEIAAEHRPDSLSVKEYMEEIMSFNQYYGTEIKSGTKLVLPLYA